LEAKITLIYEDEKKASAIAKAISPDNLKVPKRLFVATRKEGRKVVTYVKCELNFRTFMSTIDDILSCISVAERSLNTMRINK